MFEITCDSVADELFDLTLSTPVGSKFSSNYSRKVTFRYDTKEYSIRLASISAVHRSARNGGEGMITIITQAGKYTFKYRKGATESIEAFMQAWESV